MRLRLLQRFSSVGLRNSFLLAPLLLQVNHPDLPGFIDHPGVPRGVHGFDRLMTPERILQMAPALKGEVVKSVSVSTPVVVSLLLMGSAGTIGQSATSDLDYWVCLDQNRFTPEEASLFTQKLTAITNFFDKKFHAEVNFYQVDLSDLTANRIKPHGEETEGEVAPLLLKEEFYRTMLLVMGRLPLWWAVDPAAPFSQYQEALGAAEDFPDESFIDLGFPKDPSPQEYMAAALWLSRKSESDPFKGVLKMLLILDQVESGLTKPLLCDQIKADILASPKEDLPVDPYEATFRYVLDFSRDRFDHQSLDLIRVSAFMKVRGPLDIYAVPKDSPKANFIKYLVKESEWDKTRLERLNSYQNWSQRERLDLGEMMKSLLFDLYSRIAKRLTADYPGRVDAQESQLAQLRANILKRYSEHKAKVEDLPSSLHRKSLPTIMTLLFNRNRWALYGGKVETWNEGSADSEQLLIYECERAARAGAWLVNNRLFNPGLKLHIRPRPGPVSKSAIQSLLETVTEVFPPLDYKNLKEKKKWAQGGQGPRLLVINLEEPATASKIATSDLIYRTAWGEMRHSSNALRQESTEADKYLAIFEQVQASGETRPEDLRFFLPPGPTGRKLKNNLKAALTMALNRTARKKTGFGLRGKAQLDLD